MYSGKNLKFFAVAEKYLKVSAYTRKPLQVIFFLFWAVKHKEIEFIPVMS